GTKAGAHYARTVPAGGSVCVRLRLANDVVGDPFRDFDEVFARRRRESDEFYADLQADIADDDARHVQRQALVAPWRGAGPGGRRRLWVWRGDRMKGRLRRLLDETEFLSGYGVRALSRRHADEPYTFWAGGMAHTVRYQPGESESNLFGGKRPALAYHAKLH